MRSIRLTLFSSAACLAAMLFSGCGSTVMNNAMAGHAPSVASVGVQTNGVAPNRALSVQFNEAMDPSSINGQTMMVKDAGGNAVSGSVTYDQNFNVATFKASPALQPNAAYTLSVSTGAKSAQGMAMQSDFKQAFTTRAATDESPIAVKTVSPANGATCVSTSSMITITFTEGADVSTLTSANIAVMGPGNTAIPAKITYNVSTAQVTVSPNAALPSGTITVTVSNVADAAGVAMPKPYMWSFSTACTTGGGGSGGGTATTQFMAPIYSEASSGEQVHGYVSVDTAGMVTVNMTNIGANTTLNVQFCEAVTPFGPNQPSGCIAVMKVTSDSSGNGDSTAKFPQSGNWAGDFGFTDSSGKAGYFTDMPSTETTDTYSAVLLPVSSTNNGADEWSNGGAQQPLSSGTVTSSGGNVTFAVKGATPNFQYATNDSETNYIDGSGTYEMCTFTTDGQGNGSCSAPMTASSGGDIFQVMPQSGGNGYIGGFSVPQ